MNPKNTLRTCCITDENEFISLSDQWNLLVSSGAARSVFLTHEWHFSAWQWAKADSKLHILCSYEMDKLVGILPLVMKTKLIRGISVKSLEFLSVPDTQYCDVISSPAKSVSVVNVFVQYLDSIKSTWDILTLKYIYKNSLTYNLLLPYITKKNYIMDVLAETQNPFISLQGTWENFYSKKSRRLKKGNNLIENKINKASKDINIKWVHANSDITESLDSLIDTIINISAGSWKTTTGHSLNNPGPKAFIHCLSNLANSNGWLSIWLLSLNEKPVAMEYHLCYEGYVYALRSDYLDDYTIVSPGTYLNWKIIERLFSSDHKCYVMGPGDNSYKLRWCESADTVVSTIVFGHTFRGRFLGLLKTRVAPIISRPLAVLKQVSFRRK